MYALRAGLYDGETGQRLPVLDEQGREAGDAIPLQGLRVTRAQPLQARPASRHAAVSFGDRIDLVSYRVVGAGQRSRRDAVLAGPAASTRRYAAFVHVTGDGGAMLAQADGPPAGGRYPTSYWLPGEIVEDTHHVTCRAALAGTTGCASGSTRPAARPASRRATRWASGCRTTRRTRVLTLKLCLATMGGERNAMTVITLTTDFGTADGYPGVMKGVILGIAPDATLVDMSHEIPPQDIRAAAFVLKTACPYFPPGTIHVAVVDPGVGSGRRALAVRTARPLIVVRTTAC